MQVRFHYLFLSVLLMASCQKDNTRSAASPSDDCTWTVEEQTVLNELNQGGAYLFNAPDPEVADGQLQPLLQTLSKATIVGLGEATHGTAEFFRMKDLLFRQLVQQYDFRAIVFELPWGNAQLVNDFVTKGIGTAESALDETIFWVYNTEEVRDLVQWMRAYNLQQEPDDRIQFLGCDPQGQDFRLEYRMIMNYLAKVAPDSVDVIKGYYDQLPSGDLPTYHQATSDVHEANRVGCQRAYAFFEGARDQLIAASSEFEYERVAMAAHLIQQRERLYRTQTFGSLRDELMAFYAAWWQRILGDSAKIATWAHDFHVMDGDPIGAITMGGRLHDQYGAAYSAVGFSKHRGSLNAWLSDSNFNILQGVRRRVVETTPCGSVNRLLNEVNGDRHYLLLNELTGNSRSYFNSSRPVLSIGSGFNPAFTNTYINTYRVSAQFDVLIHFDATNASVLR